MKLRHCLILQLPAFAVNKTESYLSKQNHRNRLNVLSYHEEMKLQLERDQASTVKL